MDKSEGRVYESLPSMNSLFRLLIGLCVPAVSVVFAQDPPPIPEKAFKLMQAGHRLSSAEMESVLGTERAEVLNLVRRVARSEVTEFVLSDLSRPRLGSAEARWVLLRLPDPEVLEIIGNQLAEYQMISPYGSLLDSLFEDALRSRQPKLLPYIAKAIFRNEDTNTRDFELHDSGKFNRSMYSLLWLMRLTEAIDEFSPEVRAWGRAMQGASHLPYDERREIGRGWWKDNEKAIVAGNYAAVRPGISPAQGMPAAHVGVLADPNDAKRVIPSTRTVPTTTPSNDSPVSGLPKVADGTAPRPSRWPIWISITALLAGMATWLGIRSRGAKSK